MEPPSSHAGEQKAVQVEFQEFEPPGVALGSGSEICFNALDDNGNSLIDEGCGVAQGQVQISLAWSEPSADVDLHVADPDGEYALEGEATELGLVLTADCPHHDSACHAQSYENVHMEGTSVAPGLYFARVRVEALPEGTNELQVNLGVREPGGTRAYTVMMNRVGQEATLSFQVSGEKKPEKE